jgi:hypothetical protein
VALVTKSIIHAPSSVQAVAVSVSAPQIVTVTNPATGMAPVWAGVNPLVAVYPWYGTAVQPGTSLAVATLPGQTVYTHSEAPASLTVTVQ